MKQQPLTGLARLRRAWTCSVAGLRIAWGGEPSFRQETVLFAILAPLGLWLGRTAGEKALLFASLLLVLLTELLNSAVEAVVDRISTEIHPLSGRAKDLGSAAVLLAMVNVVVVWALILVR